MNVPNPQPAEAPPGIADHLIGRHVIVRANNAGVHAGTLAAHDGQQVRLTQSRRLWYWKCAKGHSLTGVALNGLAKGSKIAGTVDDLVILDACEIITTSPEGQKSIEEIEAHAP